MQNIVFNMCEKFHNDGLRNDRALGNGRSDNNKNNNKNDIRSAWRPVSGSKNNYFGQAPLTHPARYGEFVVI